MKLLRLTYLDVSVGPLAPINTRILRPVENVYQIFNGFLFQPFFFSATLICKSRLAYSKIKFKSTINLHITYFPTSDTSHATFQIW